MNIPIITIGREFVSGGRVIGEKVAEQLGIPCYDGEIIAKAAHMAGIPEQMMRDAEEKRKNILEFIFDLASGNPDMGQQIYDAQTAVIRELAKDPCIIVGRCADYILRDQHPFRVFIYAPMEDRIARIRDRYQVESKDYAELITKIDRNRGAYYNHYTNQTWGDGRNYDLTINSGMGLKKSIEILLSAVNHY